MSPQHVTLAFLVRDDQVLLAEKKRGFGVGLWNGVGGKVEPGEALAAALVRECEEEIGIVPTGYRTVAEHDFRQVEGPNPWHLYAHVHLCHAWSGQPRETDEMARPRWFPLDAIPYDRMWSDDMHWLPQVLRGRTVLGRFTFDAQDRMLTHRVERVDMLPYAGATHVD